MHQHKSITLIACSVCIFILNPSIAYIRFIIKIRTISCAIDYGTGTNSHKKHFKQTLGNYNIQKKGENYIDHLTKYTKSILFFNGT